MNLRQGISWVILAFSLRFFWGGEFYQGLKFSLGNRPRLAGDKVPWLGRKGFGVEETPFPPTPEKGVSSQKIPISIQGTVERTAIFNSKRPFLGRRGNGVSSTPDPSFSIPDPGDFDPCKGRTDSQNFFGKNRNIMERKRRVVLCKNLRWTCTPFFCTGGRLGWVHQKSRGQRRFIPLAKSCDFWGPNPVLPFLGLKNSEDVLSTD